MPPKSKRASAHPRFPERKWGPFSGGCGVAVWLNQVQTENGPRYFRSVTFAPRRFRDAKTGQWRDASSYRPIDLPAMLLALQAAHEFCQSAPLPGQSIEEDELPEELSGEENNTP